MNEVVMVIQGLASGGIYALVVVGLVLTYRMSRFVNLAHGAMGMFVTYVFWQLAVSWGVPRWLALVVSVCAVAPILGVLVGRVLFRGLLGREESAKVAGAIVVLLLLTQAVQKLWGTRATYLPDLLPTSSFRLGRDYYVGWSQVTIILIGASLAVGMGLVLHRTRLGVQMRAVAESRAQAAAFGINVARTESVGWALATSLASLAGILVSSISTINPETLTLLVITGLAAAACGRLVGMVGAIAGSAIIGIVQSELTRLPGSFVSTWGSIPAAAPFVLLVVAMAVLSVRGKDIGGRAEDDQIGRAQTDQLLRSGTLKLSSALRRRLRAGASIRSGGRMVKLIVIAGCVAGALTGVGFGLRTSTWLFLLTTAVVWSIAFSSMALLNGLGSQVSLCQAEFMGIGALVAARVQVHCTAMTANGSSCAVVHQAWRPWVAMVVAAAVSGAVGMLVAAGTTRVRGIMLAVITMSFGYALDQTIFPSLNISGGDFGFPVQRPAGFTSDIGYWVFCGLVLLLAIAGLRAVGRSGSGRAIHLGEQAPLAATALGIRIPRYRLWVFGLSAAVAGLAGYLYSALVSSFQGLAYNISTSLLLFVILYAVGSRFILSPVLAGAAYVLIPKLLSYWHPLAGDAGVVFPVLALIALGLPGGFLGWWYARGRTAEVARRASSSVAGAVSRFGAAAGGPVPVSAAGRGPAAVSSSAGRS